MSFDEYVFGYGSLAADRRHEGFPAELSGYVRGWGVAMDNTRDLPGYKWYAAAGETRPAVFVAFLDVAERPGGRVNGLCLPVSDAELPALDARERNYERVDVSDRVEVCDRVGVGVGAGAGRVWAYVGSATGRERLRRGAAAGTAVIAEGYLDAVCAGFRALGEAAWAACAPSLDPAGLPVVALTRHDLA